VTALVKLENNEEVLALMQFTLRFCFEKFTFTLSIETPALQMINYLGRLTLFHLTVLVLLISSMVSCSSPETPAENQQQLAPLNHRFSLLHRMQGRWIDQKNDEAILEVNGTTLISEYQGDVMKTQEIIVVKDFPKNCSGQPNEEGLGFFITQTDDGPFCYQVLALDENGIRYEAVGLLE